MFIGPLLKVTVCYSLQKHLQYLMNAIPAQPVQVTINELLTCLLKCDELWKRMSLFSTSPVYHRNTVFYTTINKYVEMDSVF